MTNTEKFSTYTSSFGKSCRNFSANIFDQTKCKNCMQPREEHLGVEDAKAKGTILVRFVAEIPALYSVSVHSVNVYCTQNVQT